MIKKIRNNQKKEGFTLIELLATITVFSVVIAISVGIIQDVVRKSKDKSYLVTASNIENVAITYIDENKDDIVWNGTGTTDYYQCIQIQDLIDMGYFKGDILESKISDNRNISVDDYIYVRFDKNSKVIGADYFDQDDPFSVNPCGHVNMGGSLGGSILIDVPSGWARNKTVRIEYHLDSYVAGVKSQYQYVLNNGEEVSGEKEFVENNGKGFSEVTVEVSERGTVFGGIPLSAVGGDDISESLVISGIDKEGPIIKGNYSGSPTALGEIVVPINIIDKDGYGNSGSGLKQDSLDVTDFDISIGGNSIDDGYSLEMVNCNSDNTNCNYELKINTEYEGPLTVLVGENKFKDNVGNWNKSSSLIDANKFKISYDPNGGSGEMNDTECIYGNMCSLTKNTFSKSNYEFLGWNTKSNADTVEYNDEYVFNPFDKTKDITLYAIWKPKEDDGSKVFENGVYFCTETMTYMTSIFIDDLNSITFDNMISQNTPFCYKKSEVMDLVKDDCSGFLNSWPFASVYIHKDYVDISKVPSEHIEGDYVFGYLPLQNGGSCMTTLPCPGMEQFKQRICEGK